MEHLKNKMKLFFIFLFFIIIISLNFVNASLSISPSALQFNIKSGEIECKNLTILSQDYSGDLYSLLRWSGKNNYIDNPNNFKFNAEDLNLTVNYFPQNIEKFDGEKKIQFCVSGKDIGIYRGSLEYRTISKGNVAIGVGVWIKVIITEPEQEEQQNPSSPPENNINSGGGGGGSITTTQNKTMAVQNKTSKETKTQQVENKTEKSTGESINEKDINNENNPGITGAVIGGKGKSKIIIITLIAITIAGLILYNKENIKQKLEKFKAQ